MVLLATVDRAEQKYTLTTFTSQRECELVRQHVQRDMKRSYPGDESYVIRCEMKI